MSEEQHQVHLEDLRERDHERRQNESDECQVPLEDLRERDHQRRQNESDSTQSSYASSSFFNF